MPRGRVEAREGWFERIVGPAARQMSPSAGNDYFVLKQAAADYKQFETTIQGYHSDGSKILHNTIDAAVNAATTSRGDTIWVLEGHTETISAAAGVDADKIGLKIIGCGTGANKPTLTFTADTADIDFDAASILFKNFRLIGGVASIAGMLDVNAANVTIEDCDFYSSAAGYGILIGIITDAAANDLTVRNCTANLLTATDGTTAITETSTEFIRLVGADRALIEGNYIAGDFTTAAINGVTTASKSVRILNNTIYNIATENIAGGIDLVAACTGYIDGNNVYLAYTSGLVSIDASSCALGLNYVTNAVSESPLLFGTAEATSTQALVAAAASDLVVLQASEDSDMVVLKALLTTTTSDLVALQAAEDSDMVVLKAIVNTIASDLVALKAKYASDVP